MRAATVAFIVGASLVLLSTASPAELNFDAMFGHWMSQHGKVYSSVQERDYRLSVYQNNYWIAKEITDNDDGAVYDVTGPFSDLTQDEFAEQYLSPMTPPAKGRAYRPRLGGRPANDGAFDWVDEGVVTDVKGQGSCGSCWAFSAIGALEGVWAMAGNELVSMSPQFLVDCDTEYNLGCKGGLMDEAYKYIKETSGGVPREEDYPYKGKDMECRIDEMEELIAPVADFVFLPEDEGEIAEAIHETGPLAVALNASWLQFYRKGVSDPKVCSPKGLNHGVLMTGYGTDDKKGKDFWNLKNSWGKGWGEKGYFRMRRGKGTCGINLYVVAPILDEPEEPEDPDFFVGNVVKPFRG